MRISNTTVTSSKESFVSKAFKKIYFIPFYWLSILPRSIIFGARLEKSEINDLGVLITLELKDEGGGGGGFGFFSTKYISEGVRLFDTLSTKWNKITRAE